MGQKINPNGLRLGVNKTWDSRWFSKRNYATLLHEDIKLRSYVFKKLNNASISKVIIERAAKKLRITIYSARPGIIIGKKGADIEKLKQDLSKISSVDVILDIKEVRKPEVIACLVADNIATLSTGKLHTIHVVSKTGKNKKFNIERNSPEKGHEFTFYMITYMFGAETQTNYSCGYEGMLSHVTRMLDC